MKMCKLLTCLDLETRVGTVQTETVVYSLVSIFAFLVHQDVPVYLAKFQEDPKIKGAFPNSKRVNTHVCAGTGPSGVALMKPD